MLVAAGWKDYELIDAGGEERLERWGRIILRRPDPQALWPKTAPEAVWRDVHGHYHRSDTGGGSWEFLKKTPEEWKINYQALAFHIKLMGFKHTGLFPEQAVNWDWMIDRIRRRTGPVRVLNLFAYTGGASVAAAYAGAEVCHIDAAKGMVAVAKDNLALSGLQDRPVRFIVDDVLKFVRREQRRGRQYEGIIMDPPSYGRGPSGEIWKIEDELYALLKDCVQILAPQPVFFLINSYKTGLAPTVIQNMLTLAMGGNYRGNVMADEIGLPMSLAKLVLPCGASCRWEAQ
ncbi:MAG TPA: class I SAM-dependent methyltransferase [Bacillota bacterium]|nr:class I SAM-dependent methyltransferase [Bacillota bacterium]